MEEYSRVKKLSNIGIVENIGIKELRIKIYDLCELQMDMETIPDLISI